MSTKEDRLDRLTREWNARRSDLDISPWQIWGRITRLNDLFLTKLSRTFARHGMNFTEYQTLGALIVSGPPYQASPQTISRLNLLTSGGMTNVLKRMEAKGYITRTRNPDDGRGIIVTATDLGIERFNAVILEENALEHDLLKALKPQERQEAALIMRKLMLHIDDRD